MDGNADWPWRIRTSINGAKVYRREASFTMTVPIINNLAADLPHPAEPDARGSPSDLDQNLGHELFNAHLPIEALSLLLPDAPIQATSQVKLTVKSQSHKPLVNRGSS